MLPTKARWLCFVLDAEADDNEDDGYEEVTKMDAERSFAQQEKQQEKTMIARVMQRLRSPGSTNVTQSEHGYAAQNPNENRTNEETAAEQVYRKKSWVKRKFGNQKMKKSEMDVSQSVDQNNWNVLSDVLQETPQEAVRFQDPPMPGVVGTTNVPNGADALLSPRSDPLFLSSRNNSPFDFDGVLDTMESKIDAHNIVNDVGDDLTTTAGLTDSWLSGLHGTMESLQFPQGSPRRMRTTPRELYRTSEYDNSGTDSGELSSFQGVRTAVSAVQLSPEDNSVKSAETHEVPHDVSPDLEEISYHSPRDHLLHRRQCAFGNQEWTEILKDVAKMDPLPTSNSMQKGGCRLSTDKPKKSIYKPLSTPHGWPTEALDEKEAILDGQDNSAMTEEMPGRDYPSQAKPEDEIWDDVGFEQTPVGVAEGVEKEQSVAMSFSVLSTIGHDLQQSKQLSDVVSSLELPAGQQSLSVQEAVSSQALPKAISEHSILSRKCKEGKPLETETLMSACKETSGSLKEDPNAHRCPQVDTIAGAAAKELCGSPLSPLSGADGHSISPQSAYSCASSVPEDARENMSYLNGVRDSPEIKRDVEETRGSKAIEASNSLPVPWQSDLLKLGSLKIQNTMMESLLGKGLSLCPQPSNRAADASNGKRKDTLARQCGCETPELNITNPRKGKPLRAASSQLPTVQESCPQDDMTVAQLPPVVFSSQVDVKDPQVGIGLLQQFVRKAKPGDVIDLHGTRLIGEGPLIVSNFGIRITGGILDIAKGIVVRGSHVELSNLVIMTTAQHIPAVKITAANCTMSKCDVMSVQGCGVLVEGAGVSAQLLGCRIHDCKNSCVWAVRGARVDLCNYSEIFGSQEEHGVFVESLGSTVKLQDVTVHDNFLNDVLASGGSRLVIDSCDIWGSAKDHGVSVKKYGTTATITNSRIHDSFRSCVCASHGGKIDVEGCDVFGSKNACGVVVHGHGTRVKVMSSRVGKCATDAMLVNSGASVAVLKTLLCQSSEGHGLHVQGMESCARLISTEIRANSGGIVASQGSQVELQNCIVVGCTKKSGLSASDEGTQVQIINCQVCNNNLSAVYADYGAKLLIRDTQLSGCITDYAIVCQGKGSSVDVEECSMCSNDIGDYNVSYGGTINIDGVIRGCGGSLASFIDWISPLQPILPPKAPVV